MSPLLLQYTPGKVHPQAESETVLAGGVALYDVSDLLPRHDTRTWKRRPLTAVRRFYVHHSGMDDPHVDGFAALHVSANYSANVLGWAGTAYHVWLSRRADRDRWGRLVVYRANADDRHTWHTGLLANRHGWSIALEGNTTQQTLSSDQEEALEALIPWARGEFPQLARTWLSMHSEAHRWGGKRKPSCPGRHAEEWIRAYRDAV